jgi:O-antigen ligase
VAWFLPPASDLRLGDLEYFNTNQIANICAMGVFIAQFLASRDDGRWRVSLLLLTLTLVRSLSKATLIAFVVSQGVMLFQNKSMTRGRKAALGVAVLVLGLAFGGLFESYFNIYTNSGNQAETLTGRTGIWIYSIETGLEKPWFGNGFDSMWKVAPPFGPEMFEARHAENEVLQQFYTYGLAGIVMLAGIYGTMYRCIRGLPLTPTRVVLNGLLLFILIRGLAEAEPFDLLLPLWSITLISGYLGPGVQSMKRNCNQPSFAT